MKGSTCVCYAEASCSLLCSTVLLDAVISSAHGQITVCSILSRGGPRDGGMTGGGKDLMLHKEDYLFINVSIWTFDIFSCLSSLFVLSTGGVKPLWSDTTCDTWDFPWVFNQVTKSHCNIVMIRNYHDITFIIGVDFPLWLLLQNHHYACYPQHEITTKNIQWFLVKKKKFEYPPIPTTPEPPPPTKRLPLHLFLSPVHCAQKWFPFLLN